MNIIDKYCYSNQGALLCAKNVDNIQGRVLLQSSPFYAYDTEQIVEEARTYALELEKLGISQDRFCIKVPSTGPALNAGRILLQVGIRTLGTSLFCRAQAIAASQAGCLSISPYLNFPAFHKDPSLWPNVLDPGLERPMSARIFHILEAYQTLHKETGKVQPLLKPASFRSPREAMAMGELGCQHATIHEHILNQLILLNLEDNPPPGDAAKAKGLPSQRLAQLAKVDPLAGPNWDGKLARTDVDYLADNGSALSKAIDEDQATKTGLQDSSRWIQGQ